MKKYLITGMSCAACQNRIEKAVGSIDGVSECTVSLMTNSMTVEGTASEETVINAVKKAGYGARSASDKVAESNDTELIMKGIDNSETSVLKKRLAVSIIFLLILMYFSMGHMMLGWPVFQFMENHVNLAIVEMLLAIIIMIINYKFFTSGYKALFSGYPNMDTLVALGSTASFVYSVAELFIMVNAMADGDNEQLMKYAHNLYFESAAMIPCLITVGKLLESISKGKTTSAIKGLIKLTPKTATVEKDGKHIVTSIESVMPGDIVIVKAGENIPVDGIVTEGTGSVDEAMLTGESIPVDKTINDLVQAGTINQEGLLKIRTTRTGNETTLSQIIRMVSEAAGSKAQIARIADRISGYFVPAVIGISIFTLVIWLLSGREFSFAIARAIAVLVISCPCALGLATPVAIVVGNGVAASHGILFKTAQAQEEMCKVKTIVLDKTGTITAGNPEVVEIRCFDVSEKHLLDIACTLERNSQHPLAKAVVSYGESTYRELLDVTDFAVLNGSGITGRINGRIYHAGSYRFISTISSLNSDIQDYYQASAQKGHTPLFFTEEGRLIGIISVADRIRTESKEAVRQLKDMNINVVMATGDNEFTAKAIASQAGIEHVAASILPDQKSMIITDLQKHGKVAMVGDGINDAVALTAADLGIAIGQSSDIALDAGDIVLMKSDLRDVPAAIRLSRYTLRNIYENLFWAFFYNVLCIPLAAGFYQVLFNFRMEMSPMLAAAAMSISSFTVCMNALRINLFDIYNTKNDSLFNREPVSIKLKEEKVSMNKTIEIEGMMCEHCENIVRKALEKIDGVVSADVSHVRGTAVVELSHDVDDSVLQAAVEDKDYKVLGIR